MAHDVQKLQKSARNSKTEAGVAVFAHARTATEQGLHVESGFTDLANLQKFQETFLRHEERFQAHGMIHCAEGFGTNFDPRNAGLAILDAVLVQLARVRHEPAPVDSQLE